MDLVVVGLTAVVGASLGPVLHAVIAGYTQCPPAPCGRSHLVTGSRHKIPLTGYFPNPVGRREDMLLPSAAVVITSTAIFGFLATRHDSLSVLVALCWLSAGGLVVSLVDVAVYRIPDAILRVMLAGVLTALAVSALADGRVGDLVRAVIAGGVVFAAFTLAVVARPADMGFGDAKLAGVLAVALGWHGWPSVVQGLVAAFVLAAGYTLVALATRRLAPQGPVAFGPFLFLGTLLALLTAPVG